MRIMTEFLIDKSGKCVKRFAPTDSPLSLAGEIEKLL
jgi:glutathione peroxidase-family protein